MAYEVRTSVYEGPFDLLLHLILKEEVDLWEVRLSDVVDAFITEVERLDRLDLDLATEFLLVAATLVELKARRLLPGSDPAEIDEELLRFEERDLLLARLLECKTFKDAAQVLEGRLRRAGRTVPRTAGPEEPFRSLVPDPLERVSLSQLHAAALRGLAPRPEPVIDTYHVAPIRASVRDAVEALLVALPPTEPVSFRSLVAGIESRLEVIVRFLAVLELFKQGVVEVDQAATFAELTVRRLPEGRRVLDAASLDDWDDEPAMIAPSSVDIDDEDMDGGDVDGGDVDDDAEHIDAEHIDAEHVGAEHRVEHADEVDATGTVGEVEVTIG